MNFTKVQIIDTENAKGNLKKKTKNKKPYIQSINEYCVMKQSKSIIDVDSYQLNLNEWKPNSNSKKKMKSKLK